MFPIPNSSIHLSDESSINIDSILLSSGSNGVDSPLWVLWIEFGFEPLGEDEGRLGEGMKEGENGWVM